MLKNVYKCYKFFIEQEVLIKNVLIKFSTII